MVLVVSITNTSIRRQYQLDLPTNKSVSVMFEKARSGANGSRAEQMRATSGINNI